ncbi:hypothetical protein BJY24_000033 [Nocardia transvalensis]|uniref:Uncharacterized protein n=1 Tax=Nocardia transvalensis TaxID=37333 RepID=A0A7W9P806_9NOCA|nr:hypothetical protein [Nocardia transvalensis]MBB5911166.1 hypothetical protein [Nocardia transvalensis]
MTATNRPSRIAGVNGGTAILAAAICLVALVGIGTLTGSATITLLTTAAITAGVVAALRILPPDH